MTFGAQGISVTFGKVRALQDVTLEAPPGAVTSVVGGDGAGKSTLLRCLVGEVVPDRGHVTRPAKQHVGYMSSTSGTWRELTVDENIEFVAGVYGLRGRELTKRRDELLGPAGLTRARARLSSQLSGGMRQKLGFVLAMVHRPELVVLDEPSTGVDPVSRVELWRMIAQAAATGTAVVMATTYLDEAERASTVLVLDEGRAVLSGVPDQVIDSVRGTVVRVPEPSDRQRAWRRGRIFHEWIPPGREAAGERIRPDLEDAIIAEMLAQRSGP